MTDTETLAVFDAVMTCEPMFDNDATMEIDQRAGAAYRQRNRRALLAVAAQNGEFFKRVSEDREQAVLFASLYNLTEDEIAVAKGLLEIYKCAQARLNGRISES